VTAIADAADRELLRAALREAGAVALRYFRRRPASWTKGPGQIVTEADLAIDELLHQRLIGARPGDGWLSEERPDDGSRLDRERVWVVDPIDGTRSFAAGVAEFTISVALLVEGRAVLGGVLNPATGEHFEAALGEGAWCGGARLRASRCRDATAARLLASSVELRRRSFAELIPSALFTTLGSLAYKLALVAAGRYDGLISRRSAADWDLAAAQLLISEAGGLLGDAAGRPLRLNGAEPRHGGLIGAGTKSLFDMLLAYLTKA
jgi:myo-inositol-1(or 4)-monophosphatase